MSKRLEVPGLTPEVLRQLYLEEKLTETQIAGQFGITQVQVGRIRKRFGIPSISLGDRVGAKLPESLSEQQHQLLVGSLLGDGWMRATSPQSASFNEGHCMKQAPYTDWKAAILGDFLSGFHRGSKREKGKVFYSHNLATHSCPQLRPYYDLFYPEPERKRVFPENLPALMTPFVFAVWHMDDGNITSRGEPRIAFGLDSVSLDRACKALVRLGLKPKVYGEGSDRAIHFPKQAMLVRSLLEPHIPECMAYKLPFESEQQAVHREARLLTPAKAKSLYEGGSSVEDIALLYKVGMSTVNRRLLDAGVTKRGKGPRKVFYTLEAAREMLARYNGDEWSKMDVPEQDRIVGEIFRVLRNSPFPASPEYMKQDAEAALGSVREAEMTLTEGRIQPIRKVGIALCNSIFHNRYKASSRGVKTAYESWHLDSDLKKAIRFQLSVNDPVIPHRVLRAITMQCRTPSVFRPTVAKYIYDTYCPEGGRTWDPCSGYGGRLLGAVAAGLRYVGTDVDPETVAGNQRLTELLGVSKEIAEVHLCPAEDFDPPQVDLVFTSPPYFNRELYSHGASQSWVKHAGFNSWVEGFLRPVIRKAMGALVPGGHLVLNVADVRDRKAVVPLVDRTQEVAEAEGFAFVERLKMPLPKLNRVDPYEPVLVFRKPFC